MPAKYKQPRSVQVVIFAETRQGREYLLLRRVASHGAFWQSVTGSLEAGETHRQAAVREVFEETGMSCAEDELINLHLTNVFEIAPAWRAKFLPGTTHNEEVCFALRAVKGEVRLDASEHDDFVWADYDTAYAMLYWESTRKAYRALRNLLENASGA